MERQRWLAVLWLAVGTLSCAVLGAWHRAGARGSEPAPVPPSGGPDAFGYTYDVCVPFSWVEATGGAQVPRGVNVYRGPFPIGFRLRFYGAECSQFWVSSNGVVLFDDRGSGYEQRYTNMGIPSADMPNNMAAPFWDDLRCNLSGQVRYQVFGQEPDRILVVEWREVGVAAACAPPITFEALLFEGSNEIRFQYLHMTANPWGNGRGATVGIENANGRVGLQYSFCQPAVWDGLAISFRYPGAATPAATRSATPMATASPTATGGPTSTATGTPTSTATGTLTRTATPTSTCTAVPSATGTPTPTPVATPTATCAVTPTPTDMPMPTDLPTATPTLLATATEPPPRYAVFLPAMAAHGESGRQGPD